jgi:hypothetical protein
MKEDPPPDARCRDKFLVQSVTVPSDREYNTVSQIWSAVEQTAKGSIQEKKIRVNFLPADGSNAPAPAAVNGVGSHHEDEQPPAYSSPSPAAVTPQKPASSGVSSGMGAVSTPAERASDIKREPVDTPHTSSAEQSTMLGSAAAAMSNTLGVSKEDLQRQLDAANEKIKQLQQQASEGLRQRKNVSESSEKSGSSTTTGMQQAPAPGGVPVQIVALLCLLSFLIAWFFF